MGTNCCVFVRARSVFKFIMHSTETTLILLLILTPNISFGKAKFSEPKMISGIQNATNTCDIGWQLIPDNGCFLFDLSNTMDWEDAQVYCEDLGGYLPENIDSELEEILEEEIRLISGGSLVYSWLGATDIGNEGEWVWIHSGTKVSEFFWEADQPKGINFYNCLAMAIRPDDEENTGWFDADCDDVGPSVICQKTI